MIVVVWRELDGRVRHAKVSPEGLRRLRRLEKGGWLRILRVVRVG